MAGRATGGRETPTMAWPRIPTSTSFFTTPGRLATRLLAPLLLALTLPLAAQAQASRTWVSGVGDDANPCSRTAPCKTWAGAISKTAPGGEIDALDPGGFGAVTITKAITIDGGAGQVASVLTSGTNGINVSAGVGDLVIVRNLSINGMSSAGSGIVFNSGKSLHVQNVKIDRYSDNCIAIKPSNAATVEVLETSLSNCGTGLAVSPNSGTPASATVSVERSRIIFNTTAGVSASGAGNLVQMSNSVVFGNLLGLSTSNSGVINSFGNNQTVGNTTNGSFSGSATPN